MKYINLKGSKKNLVLIYCYLKEKWLNNIITDSVSSDILINILLNKSELIHPNIYLRIRTDDNFHAIKIIDIVYLEEEEIINNVNIIMEVDNILTSTELEVLKDTLGLNWYNTVKSILNGNLNKKELIALLNSKEEKFINGLPNFIIVEDLNSCDRRILRLVIELFYKYKFKYDENKKLINNIEEILNIIPDIGETIDEYNLFISKSDRRFFIYKKSDDIKILRGGSNLSLNSLLHNIIQFIK